MKQSDNSTLEFRSAAGVNGSGGERLPDDALANVGGDEERDTRPQTVTLLEELIEKDDNETGNNELEDEEKADTGTKVARLSVETSQNIHSSLSERKDDSKHYEASY